MTYRRVKEPKEVVVIFKTHLRGDADVEEYERTSRRMQELVRDIPGFISIKGYTAEDGEELEIVRFENEGALDAWRAQPEHRRTQERGRREFYDHYWVQACKVMREYEFRLGELERARGDTRSDTPQGLSPR
ncbi:MAG: antibiotic biosynthesis monooxygenase family protein [Methanobacteriota archaeon]